MLRQQGRALQRVPVNLYAVVALHAATPLHQLQRGDVQKPQLLLVSERQQSLDLLGQDRSVFHSYLQNYSCLEVPAVIE